jgi:uncharacterized membrane protein YccC
MLTFVLPVSLTVDIDVIPDRLLGWALACTAGIAAQMLLWPDQPRNRLRVSLARACRALADATESVGSTQEAEQAVNAARDQFFATPYRPTGATEASTAATVLVDELEWYKSLVRGPPGAHFAHPLCAAENDEVITAAASVLRASADRFAGQDAHPDFIRLAAARDALAQRLPEQVAELPRSDPDELLAALDPLLRLRALCFAANQIATYTLAATGAERPRTASALHAVRELVLEHASTRSVWFRDSVRGAAALAIAVFVARETGVQNGFWVVLGTLSVLRSNALGTGATILSALAGTAVGIVVGALIVVAIGTDTGVLWALLPLAVLLAAYAPRIVSFAAGQAGFTILLLILFNIIAPVGWRVGIVRVQDVAIGFAISLAVGIVFWPRGASALVRNSVAAAYVSGVEFVDAAVGRLVDLSAHALADRAAQQSDLTTDRLDDAFRHYMTERSAKRVPLDDVAILVAGAGRVRRVALSLRGLARATDGMEASAEDRVLLADRSRDVREWYFELASALVERDDPPAPRAADGDVQRALADHVGRAAAAGDHGAIRLAVALLWASEHLALLTRLEGRVAPAAAEAVASQASML